jgi:WD40 repeat protein
VRVGPYEVVDELGRGGMGVVYRARHLPTGALRALKVVQGSVDPESLERFKREAEALARSGGEGVVPVHEAALERGRLYVAMGLMAGGSLRARLEREGRLDWRVAVALVRDLARTLDRCHALGLVHRDLKPENVLFDEEGRPHLADFGAVRDLTATALTETGTVIGTPVYMPPEQLDGKAVDARADIYALGVMLEELVTGVTPHAGVGSLYALLTEKLEGKRRTLGGEVPARLEAVVARATAPRAEGRHASAGALAADLDALLGGGRPPKKRGIIFAPLAVAASALAFAVALALRPVDPGTLDQGTKPAPAAPVGSGGLSLELLGEWGSRDWKHAHDVRGLAFSPDGSRVLSESIKGNVRLWDVATGKELLSFDHREGDDGKAAQVAFLSNDRVLTAFHCDLWLWDLATGARQPAARLRVGGELLRVAIAEGGTRALVASKNEGKEVLSLWELNDSLEPARLEEGKTIGPIALSPDGRAAVLVADGEVELWDLSDKVSSHRRLPGLDKAVTALAFRGDGKRIITASANELRAFDLSGAPRGGKLLTLREERDIVALAVRGSKALVAWKDGREVALVDLGDMTEGAHFPTRAARDVLALALSPDGARGIASTDRALHVWDLGTGRELALHEKFGDAVEAVDVSADGTRLVAGCQDGTLRIGSFDAAGRPVLGSSPIDRGKHVQAVALSPTGDLAVSGSGDIKVWNLSSMTSEIRPGSQGFIWSLAFSPLGTRFASAYGEGRGARVWHRSGGPDGEPLENPDVAFRVAFSPDGARLATTGLELTIWDLERRKPTVVSDTLPKLEAVAWSRDGKRLASANEIGIIFVADAESATVLQVIGAHERHWAHGLALSADGGRVVSAGEDGAICAWDVASGELLAENLDLARLGDHARCLVALPGDRRFVVGTARGVVATFELAAR